MAMIISVGQAVAYVYSGMYGPITDIGVGNGILIVIQLAIAGLVIILLDEMLQ